MQASWPRSRVIVWLMFLSALSLLAPSNVAAQDNPGVEPVSQVGHSDRVTSVAFSPNGRTVLSGSCDQTLKLWDAATGKLLRTFEGHSSAVWSVAFSPDGRTALSGSDDKTLKLWDAATGRLLRSFEGHSGSGGVWSVAFSRDGRTVLSSGGYDETFKLWDAATGKLLRTFEGHSGPVSSVAFSPDGRTALSGSGERRSSCGMRPRASSSALSRAIRTR